MKLVKIYANKPFKRTQFNPGFNVILGEPREKGKKDNDLERFNRQVSEERKKYMTERLQELKQELQPIEDELADLEITAEGSGTTYKKLLCMAFDLSVLLTYKQQSFYRFVYHDGALEGLDDRKKIKFLAEIRDICQSHGIQYILTVIDSDVPWDQLEKKADFTDDEIVLKLHDRDDSGRLFETGF